MVEKIMVNPNDVRAYGNIMNSKSRTAYQSRAGVLVNSNGTTSINNVSYSVLKIQRSNTSITASSYSGYVGTGALTATLKATSGLADKEVSLTLGTAVLTATTNSSGVASFDLSSMPAGTYTGYLHFNGDSSYNSCDKQVTVAINKYATALTLSSANSSRYPTETNEFTVTLKQGNNGISGAPVDIYVDNTLYATVTTDSSGVATHAISFTTVGTRNVYAVFNGDDTYLAKTSSTLQIAVSKKSTSITVSGLSSNAMTHYRDDNTISTQLKDTGSGEGMASSTLSFSFRNTSTNATVTRTATTDSSGNASLNLSNALASGTYNVTVQYASTTVYNASSKTFALTVSKHSTSLALETGAPQLLPSTGRTVTATLKDNSNNPISGATVKLYVNNALNATLTTNAQGKVSKSLSWSAEGTYSIQAKFEGTDNYSDANSEVNSITVEKQVVSIEGDSTFTKGYFESKDITVRLHNMNVGTYLSNASVRIQMRHNDATFSATATTDSSGYARFTIGSGRIEAGTFTCTVYYDGTATTQAMTKNIAVTVSTIPTSVAMDSLTSVYVGSGALTATLRYNDGTASNPSEYLALANQSITFKVGSTSYTRTTNSSGVATLDVSGLSVGSYSVSATFNGSGSYASASKSGTLTVNAKKVITINIDDDVYINSNPNQLSYVPVRLTSGSQPVANKEIAHTSGAFGMGYVTTDSQGYASIPLAADTELNALLRLSVSEDGTYAAASKDVMLHVWDFVITAEILQIVNYWGVLEFTVWYQGGPIMDIPLTITYPDSHTQTTDTDLDGHVVIEGACRGTYVARYQGYSLTFEF